MQGLYAVNARALATRFDALLDELSDVRRGEVLACRNMPERLRRLGAGLLLRRNLGADALVRDGYGKPTLPGKPPFSIAHSGDWAVLAVHDTDVGVDIERVRDMRMDAFARRWFTQDERAAYLDAPDQRACFFSVWCMKESVMKLDGRGLAMAPDTFCVLGGNEWYFQSFSELPGYALVACARAPIALPFMIQTF